MLQTEPKTKEVAHMQAQHAYGESLSDLILWLMYTHVLSKMPYGLGRKVKNMVLRRLFKRFGTGARVSTSVRLIYPQGITIGNDVGIPRNVTLDGRGGIDIGDDTMIGFESIILTSTHISKDKNIPIRKQGMFRAPVKIGKNVWTGARVIILPGVTVGDGAIIAANSVVSKDIPSNTVYGGVPASFIRER